MATTVGLQDSIYYITVLKWEFIILSKFSQQWTNNMFHVPETNVINSVVVQLVEYGVTQLNNSDVLW